MKKFDFTEEKEELKNIKRFYEEKDRERGGIATLFKVGWMFIIPPIIGIIIDKTEHNRSKRIEPIDKIMRSIEEIETKSNFIANKNLILNCFSTIQSFPSDSKAYRTLVAVVEKIKNKIDDEVNARNEVIAAREMMVVNRGLLAQTIFGSPGIRDTVSSFLYHRFSLK